MISTCRSRQQAALRVLSAVRHGADAHGFSPIEPVPFPSTEFQANLSEIASLKPDAVFVFTSTNKVYGDAPNRLPLVERDTRWEVAADHRYHRHGIDETPAERLSGVDRGHVHHEKND